jgi:uncharacterized integral membrane protein (TIGR00698 family)
MGEKISEKKGFGSSKFWLFINERRTFILAVVIGIIAVLISDFTNFPVLDPLFVALVSGILISLFINLDSVRAKHSFDIALKWLIPVGVVFYGAVNLNFIEFASVDRSFMFILIIVFLVFIFLAFYLSKLFGLNNKIGSLVAGGSAICGASAIAIMTPAVKAEPEDVSNSLIAVFISALIGLLVVLPIFKLQLGLSDEVYAIFAGSVLQFTGFVKVAVASLPSEFASLALSVKAVRYLGLLFAIPYFSTYVKNKFNVPFYLFFFVGAGLLFSFVGHLDFLRPFLKVFLDFLWSVAMAVIGLNASARVLFTKHGFNSVLVGIISFLVACVVFLISANIFLKF